jgi:hypothetical protein
MQVKEWLYTTFKIIHLRPSTPLLSINYLKGGTHAMTLKVKGSHVNFKCASKGSGFELLAFIAFNKNE